MKTEIYYGSTGLLNMDLKPFCGKIATLQPYTAIQTIPDNNWISSFFLDSGAFTAWRQGTPINLEEYIKFIKTNKDKLTIYANLDVIKDGKSSFENYMKMRDAGLNPLPVWHLSTPVFYLKEYIKYTNYIGIGELAKGSSSFRKGNLDSLFKKYPNPEEIGFHGFGIGDPETLREYPWKSVDATSIHMQARYGGIYFPGKGWLKVGLSVSEKDKRWRTPLKEEKVVSYIKSLGICPALLFGRTSQATMFRTIISIKYFENLKEEIGDRKPYKGYGFII